MNSSDVATPLQAEAACDESAAQSSGSRRESQGRVRTDAGRGKHFRAGLWRLAWVFLGAVAGPRVQAHDPGLSTAQGELRADALVLTTGFAPADAQQLLPPAAAPRDTTWTSAEFEAAHDALLAVGQQLWEVESRATKLTAADIRVELLAGDNVSFHHVFRRGAGTAPILLRARKLPELPAGHRQFVIITDERGSVITKKLLSARDITLEIPLAGAGLRSSSAPPSNSDNPTFWSFIRLGIEHIWTGFDHLLFLFGLLVVCRSFRSIVAIVSCFTLAHSLTLALATLEIVNVPAGLVEPAIAASIVFVGAENLLRRGQEPPKRWALTFAFGLIHGFGFASVLRDLGIGSSAQGVTLPLFAFNLGVEIGQIAIAAIVLPAVWQLRKRAGFLRLGVPALSALVAGAGVYWLLQRTLFA